MHTTSSLCQIQFISHWNRSTFSFLFSYIFGGKRQISEIVTQPHAFRSSNSQNLIEMNLIHSPKLVTAFAQVSNKHTIKKKGRNSNDKSPYQQLTTTHDIVHIKWKKQKEMVTKKCLLTGYFQYLLIFFLDDIHSFWVLWIDRFQCVK